MTFTSKNLGPLNGGPIFCEWIDIKCVGPLGEAHAPRLPNRAASLRPFSFIARLILEVEIGELLAAVAGTLASLPSKGIEAK
jgi:hypothetical protein